MHANLSLPLELLQQIFYEATSIPDATSIHGYSVNERNITRYYDQGDEKAIASLTDLKSWDLRRTFHTRKSIVRVCKHWHTVGIPILYSQIIIQPKPNGNLRNVLSLRAAFERRPELGAHVHRIYLFCGSVAQSDRVRTIIQSILDCCSNVQILCGWSTPPRLTLPTSLVFLLLHSLNLSHHVIGRLPNLRSLTLWLQAPISYLPNDKPHLPQLVRLDILGRFGPSTVPLLEGWNLPSLQYLSLPKTNSSSASILRRFAPYLTTLKISVGTISDRPGIRIPLPNLRLLIIGDKLLEPAEVPRCLISLASLLGNLPELTTIRITDNTERTIDDMALLIDFVLKWFQSRTLHYPKLTTVQLPYFTTDSNNHKGSHCHRAIEIISAGCKVEYWNQRLEVYRPVLVNDSHEIVL